MQLIAEALSSVRGGRALFSRLSFRVGAGEALVVTGPNGAGKTTLLRMLAGLLRPAAGAVRVEGGAPDALLGEECHLIGHLDAVKGRLTVWENAAFWSRFLGGSANRVNHAVETFGLGHLSGVPASYLSAGQKRRLGLARLVVVDRPIWLLDEPTASLDAEGQGIVARVVNGHLRAGGLVVAATHAALGFVNARELALGPAAEPA